MTSRLDYSPSLSLSRSLSYSRFGFIYGSTLYISYGSKLSNVRMNILRRTVELFHAECCIFHYALDRFGFEVSFGVIDCTLPSRYRTEVSISYRRSGGGTSYHKYHSKFEYLFIV